MFSCSRTMCWKYYHSCTELLLHFCQKSVGHICVGLFLESLFCSSNLCVCPSANTTLSSLMQSYDKSWNRVGWFLPLDSSLSKLFQLFYFLCNFHKNFRIILSISAKNRAGILIGIGYSCISIWEKMTSLECWAFHSVNTEYPSIRLDHLWSFMSVA